MELLLTNQEKETLFYNCLVEVYGNSWFSGYGLGWWWKKSDYNEAREKLKEPCVEDVIMQILRDGKSIKIKDVEGEGEYTREITMQLIYDNATLADIDDIFAILKEEGNADIENCDRVLQKMLFKEVVFG